MVIQSGSVAFWKRVIVPALLASVLGGCQTAGVLDPAALAGAKSVGVLPGVGAPGMDGSGAGPMQGGLLITSIVDLQRFQTVQGPAAIRKAADARKDALWDPASQAQIARDLGIDLFAVSEVLEYRFQKKYRSSSAIVTKALWTETTHFVTTTVRLIRPQDGRMVYCGTGRGESKDGYGPAVLAANTQAMQELKAFLQKPQPTDNGKQPN
ncbi:MAG: hypothetical protein WCK05_00995 [Planctomycetota bacterium]